jgi:hypothetical protein
MLGEIVVVGGRKRRAVLIAQRQQYLDECMDAALRFGASS